MGTLGWEGEFLFLKSPDQIREEDRPFYPGHEEAIAAGVSACRFVADPLCTVPSLNVLLSGWPGSGKTLYPAVLAATLNDAECPYAYLHVSCGRIVARLRLEEVRAYLADTWDILESLGSPTLVALDELDALAPGRTDNPGLMGLTMWVLDLLERRLAPPRRFVTLGVTNDPVWVDKALRDRFQFDLYFPPATDAQLTEILAHYDVPNVSQTLGELKKLLAGARVTGRSVAEGARFVQALDLAGGEPAEIARALFTSIASLDEDEVREYERRNRARIERSRLFIEQWVKRAP